MKRERGRQRVYVIRAVIRLRCSYAIVQVQLEHARPATALHAVADHRARRYLNATPKFGRSSADHVAASTGTLEDEVRPAVCLCDGQILTW